MEGVLKLSFSLLFILAFSAIRIDNVSGEHNTCAESYCDGKIYHCPLIPVCEPNQVLKRPCPCVCCQNCLNVLGNT